LFHRACRATGRLCFSIINLGNVDALYNFLSSFSATHSVTPRAHQI